MSNSKRRDLAEQTLTLADIESGGEEPAVAFEVPELAKNGRPGVLWLRHLPAGDVMDFIEAGMEQESEQAKAVARREAMFALVPKAIVRGPHDLVPIFDGVPPERIRNMISITVFNRLLAKITEMSGLNVSEDAPEGNASGEAPTSASPTA